MGCGCVGQDLQGLPQSEAEMQHFMGGGRGGKQWVFCIRSDRYGFAEKVGSRGGKDGDGVGEDEHKVGHNQHNFA